MKHVNQKKIAELVGVSVMAVSAALGGTKHASVSKSTKRKILKVAKRLGYFADARGSLRRICLGLDPKSGYIEPFYSELSNSLEKRAKIAKYSIVYRDIDINSDVMDFLVNLKCDGVIFFQIMPSELIHKLREYVPVVLINRLSLDYDCDMICFDDLSGIYILVEHLFALGHRRIAFFGENICRSGSEVSSVTGYRTSRIAGYMGKIFELGLEIDNDLIVTNDKKFEESIKKGCFHEEACKYLMGLKKPPTAIVAYNDIVARSIVNHLLKMGIRVPEDVSVTGFDDISCDKDSNTKLTTVNPGLAEVGHIAFEQILMRINCSNNTPAVKITVRPKLVVGNTTAPPPKFQISGRRNK